MMDFDALKAMVKRNWDAGGKYRECMDHDFAFRDGHQWTPEEKAALDDTQQADIVFNRTAVIISSVSGSEINNRTEVRFIPREIGDAKPNEVLTAGAEWFRDEGNAEDEDSAAFDDMLVCGIGFTETYLDFEEDEDGAPRTQRIDPREMGWDFQATRKGLSNATCIFRVRKIPMQEARDMWPDAKVDEISAGWIDVDKTNESLVNDIPDDNDYNRNNPASGFNPNTAIVVQCQYRERQTMVEYLDPETGSTKTMTTEQWKRVEEMLPGIPNRKVSRYVWKQAFLGNVMLGESQPCEVRPTFTPITGRYDSKDQRWYGLLRSMKDPQKFANKWLSLTLHIIKNNAKGGVLIEEGAVSDMSAFAESWAASDSVTFVKDGRMQSLTPKPGPQMPASLMQLTEYAVSAIRDVSGVSLELMGLREAQQSGVLEYQRRQSSMTTLAFYFDSLRYYRKRQGDVILWFLTKWIAPTGRLVRIVKDGLQEYVPLATDDDTRKYDVIVDDSPQAPNEKERAWSVIQAMMPMLQTAGLSIEDWADVLEYSPLPASFADMVRSKAQEQQQQGPDPMQQLAIAAEQADIEETQANTQYKLAQAANLGQREQTTLASRVDHPVEVAARAQQFESATQLNLSLIHI